MKVKVLWYCTKGKPSLIKGYDNKFFVDYMSCFKQTLNGKIIAESEVECEEINVIHHYETNESGIFCYDEVGTKTLDQFNLLQKSCLTRFELSDYLGTKGGYALHISNLKMFDRPMELKEFKKRNVLEYWQWDAGWELYSPLTEAPQNMRWCYYKGEKCCLISIQPQWLCKILNGEKTIEVRKKIMKGMIL